MLLCEMFTGLRDSTVTNRTDVIRLRIRTTISGLPVAVFLWPASQSTQTNFLNTWTALFWVISRRVTVREITATCCVTTQKTAVLSYFAAEAANHTNFLYTFIYLSSTAANKVSWIRCEGQNFFRRLLQPWRWRLHDPSKRQEPHTQRHLFAPHKCWIINKPAVRNTNLPFLRRLRKSTVNLRFRALRRHM